VALNFFFFPSGMTFKAKRSKYCACEKCLFPW
jgi:hypothetical protein